MNEKLLEKYAEFAVKSAVNVQKGQTFLINSPIETAAFARLCAKAGYDAGAKEVVIHYSDEKLSRIKMKYTETDVLCDVKPWIASSYLDYCENDGDTCVLYISSSDPEIYKGLDTEKINKALRSRQKALKQWRELTLSNRVQWSIVALPNEKWAEKIFGDDPEKIDKLWQAIFDVSRVSGGDPVGAWEEHAKKLHVRRDLLNNCSFESLHLKAANGTDITIGLPEGHVWGGARESTTTGTPFFPNVPTEEVFTAPHSHKVNGIIKSSMPYVYNGNLIEGIVTRFEDGKVVEYSATKGMDLLEQMLETDEGSKRLGEVALVPASSPIKQTGLLFYNTLFDENAACHIAFGASYPDTIKNGSNMTNDERKAKGMNDSLLHEDVMVGTEDMDIDGIKQDGSRVALFRGGEWVI